MSSKYVLFVVISLLIVAIVSTSVLKARALPPERGYLLATNCSSYDAVGHHIETCCWAEEYGPGDRKTVCQKCDTSEIPMKCGDSYFARAVSGGPTTGPLNLTTTQNGGPITTPGGPTHGPPSTSNAPPISNATAGNPTLKGTTGSHSLPVSKGRSGTVPNNTILSTHHHKTSNLGHTSGSASTGNSTGH